MHTNSKNLLRLKASISGSEEAWALENCLCALQIPPVRLQTSFAQVVDVSSTDVGKRSQSPAIEIYTEGKIMKFLNSSGDFWLYYLLPYNQMSLICYRKFYDYYSNCCNIVEYLMLLYRTQLPER